MSFMSIKTFLQCAKCLPDNISVLLRGETGIGKSQLTYSLGAFFGLRVLERRLSQMSEGDMIGLPSTDGNVTRFNPPDWYKDACDGPVLLYLDELNRATPEVMQAAFQIVLDRQLNGWTLHPETRVYSSINTGSSYTVNEVDPALLRRFWVIDLAPTLEDWLLWAKDPAQGNIHENMWSFIAQGEKWLNPARNAEPGDVQPTPHSYERLDRTLKHANITEDAKNSLFYSLSLGFIGTEATIAFTDYVKSIDNNVTAEEILSGFDKVQKKIEKLGQEKWNLLSEKVSDYVLKLDKVTKKQGTNLEKFAKSLPAELRINLWMKLIAPGLDKIELIKSIHPFLAPTVLDVFGVPYGVAGVGISPNIPDCLKPEVEKAKK